MRAYPNDAQTVPEETLETRLAELCEKKMEYRKHQKEFKDRNKDLLESIKSLENIVIAEVMEMQKTVIVGNIKAEFKPNVVIKLRKEKTDEQ